MDKKIDNEFTDEPVCPWCGYELFDAWEYDDEVEDEECCECDKKFDIFRHHSISYSTTKKKCETCEYELKKQYNYKEFCWNIYSCKVCDNEVIKTGPKKDQPYIIPLENKDV